MWWTNQIPNVPGLSFFLVSEVYSSDFMMLFMALIACWWKLETQDPNEVWWNVYSFNKLEQCWYSSGPLLIWDYSLLRCPPLLLLAPLFLHFLVICRLCSHEGSLLAFKLSLLVIWFWDEQSLHDPFSYRHAFLHFFWIVFVCSQVFWSPFFRVRIRDLMFVFGSQSDHVPFT